MIGTSLGLMGIATRGGGITVALDAVSGVPFTAPAPDGFVWIAGDVTIRVQAATPFGTTTEVPCTITTAGVVDEVTDGAFADAVDAAGAIAPATVQVRVIGATVSRIIVIGEMLALDATRASTAPLTTDYDDLSTANWTKNRAAMVVTALDDGFVRIAADNGAWNALINDTPSVIAGDEYLIRIRYRRGTALKAIALVIADPVSSRTSAYRISAEGVVDILSFAVGAIRLVGSEDSNGDVVMHLRWVPNFTGSADLRIGPNSAVLGEYVDVLECGLALRNKLAAPAALFVNPMDTPINSNFANIDTWEDYSMSARADNPNADAEVGRMPQRLTGASNFRTVRTLVNVVAGRRYVASASWKKGVEPDRVRLGLYDAAGTAMHIAYLRFDASTETLVETGASVENIVYERNGDWRRVSFEFVAPTTGARYLGVGPYGFEAGQYIDLYRAGIAEAAGVLQWRAPISATNDFDVAWPDATDADVVEQNYVHDSLLTFSANVDGAPELAISLPAGSFGFRSPPDAPLGGLGFYDRFRSADGGDLEGVLSYDVKLGSGFVYGKGGKLPGLMHGTKNSGNATDPSEGWSVRYMWGPSGVPYIYIYDTDRDPPADDLTFAGGILLPGQWHNITQRIKLNTLGQSDGEIEVFMDGVQVALLANQEIRLNNLHTIEGILFDIFFGGGDVSWAHVDSETISIRNMKYWSVA